MVDEGIGEYCFIDVVAISGYSKPEVRTMPHCYRKGNLFLYDDVSLNTHSISFNMVDFKNDAHVVDVRCYELFGLIFMLIER